MARRNYIALIALLACVGSVSAQDYFDDVYYNPKKDKATTVKPVKEEKKSYYIANMADMDVDAYNRRGEQYYVSQIDTIGTRAENGEDFVYTQQIQKFYNPTIVVENANTLGDVLSNAYGNVDIIINDNGLPVFGPWYGWNWPYYSYAWSPWSWSWNIGPWGWSIGWYDPWFAWGWGPSWGPAWGPGWGWGPAWRPGPVGPGWGPGWGPGRPGPGYPPMANWNPRGNRVVGPRPGWSGATQPGHNMVATRPANGVRPNGTGVTNVGNHRPGNLLGGATRPSGVVNNNGKWEYNTSNSTGHRTSGTGVVSNKNNQTTTRTPATTTNKSTVTNNRTTTNRSTVTNRSTPSRSTGMSRSTGSRSTGGRSTGGGGGRHR